MKKLLSITTALGFAASTSMAGDLAEPTITEVEEPAAAASSAPWLPLILLVGVGLLIASQDDNSDEQIRASDMRVKRDIVRVGTAANGLPLYQYKYLWSDTVYEGVMAQDVLKAFPDAIVRRAFGLLTVNYSTLGLKMTKVSA